MSTTAEAKLEIENWDEQPIDDAEPKITRATITGRISGDIDGTSRTESVMAYRPDGSAVFVGLERIEGVVHGRKGSLLLRHIGSYEDGVARAAVDIVSSAATDELAEVEGSGEFVADPSPSLRLELSFG